MRARFGTSLVGQASAGISSAIRQFPASGAIWGVLNKVTDYEALRMQSYLDDLAVLRAESKESRLILLLFGRGLLAIALRPRKLTKHVCHLRTHNQHIARCAPQELAGIRNFEQHPQPSP